MDNREAAVMGRDEGVEALRLVTYNVHKCRGLDNRVRPQRIVRILRQIGADIIALQEVLCIPSHIESMHQADYIAAQLGMLYCIGENRRFDGGAYGNVILSHFPIVHSRNYDISVPRRESRGCLRADISIGDRVAHVFNVHLGTSYMERRRQVRRLIDTEILHNEELQGARIILGDFNEWTRGLTTRTLSSRLNSVEIRKYIRSGKTYPGILPILHLDHIYFDPGIKLATFQVCRTRDALIASDHLPLIADFHWEAEMPAEEETPGRQES